MATWTAGYWLTLMGIVVTSATALIIAHMQRKQMRQIELYKTDQAVGLLPPPSPPIRFIKKHAANLLVAISIVTQVLLLADDMLNPTIQLTKWRVLEIVFTVAMMLFMVMMLTLRRIADFSMRQSELVGRIVTLLGDVVEQQKSLATTLAAYKTNNNAPSSINS